MGFGVCVIVLLLALSTGRADYPYGHHQTHVVLKPPKYCRSVLGNQTQEINLKCVVPPGTVWKFEWVQHWAKDHVRSGLNVNIRCDANSTVIMRQPIKAFLLRSLDIYSCEVRQMYDYDLTVETANIPFTIRTMEVKDSVYCITFKELQTLYVKHSRDVISKYPCYLPPSVVKYVERNVTIKSEGRGTKQQFTELREAFRKHSFRLPQCEYRELRYYEKSFSRKSKLNFVRKFLDKGKFPSLQMFNISYLQLNSVPVKLSMEDWSEKFPKMNVLDVSNNNIDHVPFEFPPKTQRNITINMTRNNVTVITKLDLDNLEKFYPGKLLLQDNPLSCSCQLKPLVYFVRHAVKPYVQHYAYMRNLTCASPLILRNRVVVDVSLTEMCPEEDGNKNTTSVKNLPSYVFIITLPIVLLLVVVIMALFRYRKELKILAFTRFAFTRSRANREEMSKKEYDAFVSYSSHDELFVKRMCTRLEGPPYEFKLCLHYKHFVPGLCISENIIESVETSRHTIIILSKGFMQSEWCILEFRKAFHQSLIEHNKHLIVILLEEIEDASLQPDMTYFLQTHTYLRADEYLFWDKLVYTLSDKQTGRARDKKISSVNRKGKEVGTFV